MSLRREDDGYLLEVENSAELLEHGVVVPLNPTILEAFRGFPRLRKSLQAGNRVILPKSVIRHIGFADKFTTELFRSIGFELTVSQAVSAALLTSRSIEVEILQKLTSDVRIERRNRILHELLTCVVPFADELTAKELLALRDEEGDSFVLFRTALAKAADNVKSEGLSVKRSEVEQLYSDVVEPELAKLNIVMARARRGMVKSARRSIMGWTAAISFGVYYGLVPETLRDAAKALGLTKAAADILTKLMNDSDGEETIRGESMYFLWKVKEAALRKTGLTRLG